MLTEYNQVQFTDQERKNDVICEINVPGKSKDTIAFTMRGLTSYIKIKDFYSVCLLLVKNKQIEKLFPVIERKVKKYKRQFEVVAKKDIKKGETIKLTYEVDVNNIIADNINNELNVKRNNGNEIPKS